MKEWFTIAELAELKLPDMPSSVSKVHELAIRDGWKTGPHCRKLERRGGGFEYHMSLLPHRAQVKLSAILHKDEAREETREKRKRLYWAAWEAMTDDHRMICHFRHNVLTSVELALETNRHSDTPSSKEAILATILGKYEVSVSTYYVWQRAVSNVDPEDWLPALAPSYTVDGEIKCKQAEVHPEAWSAFKSDYLRPEGSGFSSCYRRVEAVAKKKGWAPWPSERALRRRLDAEVDKAVQVYARKGQKKAEALYPPQVRTKDHLHALQIVNTDGHKIDLFTWAPWNTRHPVRLILIGIQDIYSGKILSWRLAAAETWDVVRACIGDMIEDYGIPEKFYMDNGRAFASNAISGGSAQRNRFRKSKKKANRFGIDEEEVGGILVNFGIEPHFTRPYAGQSKPIERAWKDLAEEIAKHPAMSGAYTGNTPDAKPENYGKRAVPLEVLQAHVADRIAEHNARTGRKAATAKGRSFDQTFEESFRHPGTIIRRATDAQRDFWMLAEKVVTARKDRGAIHYLDNIYWSPELIQWAQKKVKIRFDPDALHDPIKVYAPDGRLICAAPCTEKGRFDDVEAAHVHARNRKTFLKRQKDLLDAHRTLAADELAELYETGEKAEPKKPMRPVVTRIATGVVSGNLAVQAQDVFTSEEFEAGIAASLSSISGDSSIIPFRPSRSTGRKHRAE
ncbi:MAG: transposase [Shinella sp.]|nr:MAG: transposase [Shinella sp.]